MDLHLPSWLETLMTFVHPVLMWLTFGIALYALYLGMKVRKTRTAEAEERKTLIKGKFAQRHFQMGSWFMLLMVMGAIGGMAVTYVNNGKLFVGPHLLAGLGLLALVAVAVALVPAMQQGRQWARNLHIFINVIILACLGWQAATGIEIVQRIVTSMTQPVA